MASGNGSVELYHFPLRIPEGLRYLVERYKNDRVLASFNAAVVELLETHPEIVKRLERIYTTGVEHLEHSERSGAQDKYAERDDP